MFIRACILTLLIVYPVFLGAGILLYRYAQKKKPAPFPETDPRARLLKPLRFILHIIVLPPGATLALAVPGWLDPLYHLVRPF